MGTIAKRTTKSGKVHFRARIRLQGYPDQSATFATRTAAKDWVKTTEAAIIEGRHGTKRAKQHTLAEAIDRYLDDNLPALSESEQRNRKRHLVYWKKQLGKMSLAQLCNDADPIRLCMKQLARGNTARGTRRAPATANRYYASLSKLFTCAMRWNWARSNPLRMVDRLREQNARDRYLDETELKRLLEATAESKDPYLDVAVKLALTTGGRYAEIMGLTWSQVSVKRKSVTFRNTKNRDDRTVPLVEPALSAVKALRTNRRKDSDLLFPWTKPDQPKDIRAGWVNALKAAKIKDFRFHDLRHTCASYLAMNGARPSELAAVLGHKTLAMVKRYSHVSEVHTAELVRSMAEKRFGNGK